MDTASLRKIYFTLGAVCLGAAFLPHWSTIKTSPPPVERDEFSIGMPSGPWVRFINERRENSDDTVTYTKGHEYVFAFESALPAFAGVVLLILGRRTPPAPMTQTPTPTN